MVTTPTNQMKVMDTKIYKCLWDAVAGPEYRLPSQVYTQFLPELPKLTTLQGIFSH